MGVSYWIMGNSLVASPQKKMTRPPPDSHQLLIAPQQKVGPHEPPIHEGRLWDSVLPRLVQETSGTMYE